MAMPSNPTVVGARRVTAYVEEVRTGRYPLAPAKAVGARNT
jgi:hypothetical protein